MSWVSRIGIAVMTITLGCDASTGVNPLPPSTPQLMLPANGSRNEQNAVYLEWFESPDATKYHIQVSSDEEFINPHLDFRGQVAPILAVKELDLDKTYYWRVRAYNDAESSNWSAPWWFRSTTRAKPPPRPHLIYPANEQEELPSTVEFRWAPVETARFYHIQASQSDDFYNMEADMNMLPVTAQTVSQLVNGYVYFWRVRARNAAGFGPWSPTWYIIIADFD